MRRIDTHIGDKWGTETGIRINNERVLIDRGKDRIVITGRIEPSSDKAYTNLLFEPEIQADLINRKNQVCHTCISNHEACYAASQGKQGISFIVRLECVSDYISWEDIDRLEINIVFRKSSPTKIMVQYSVNVVQK